MKRAGLFFVVLFFISEVSFPRLCFAQSPAVTAGINFLVASQNADGSWGSDSSSADQVAASATVLQTLSELDNNSSAAYLTGTGWLSGLSLDTTDNISRRILAGSSSALDPDLLHFHLDNLRKAWGGKQGYDVNLQDTALALLALKQSNSTDISTIGYGLNFLLSQQNPDGGWGFADGSESEIYTTTLTILALQKFDDIYALTNQIAKGNAFLLVNQNGDGGFGLPTSTVHETALTCLALLDDHLDAPEVVLALQYLSATQLSDGSWVNDPFETSLALLPLEANDRAHLPPAPSSVIGKVVTSVTGQPLVDVTVTISGNATATMNTTADGAFSFGALNAGAYSLQFTLAGYQPASKTITLAAGVTSDLGILSLPKIVMPVTSIRGTVTEANTGLPVLGATVHVSGASVASTETDSTGGYSIEGLSPGSIVIVIAKAGYTSALAGATVVSNQTLIFSPVLTSAGTPSGGGTGVSEIGGQVIDNATGQALSEVTIAVSGNVNATVNTLPDGTFTVGNLGEGTYTLQFTLPGYQTDTRILTIVAGVTYDLGKLAMNRGVAPVTAIRGIVTTADSGLPMSGALVSVSGANVASTVTDTNGDFAFENLNPGTTTIVVSRNGYESSTGVATVVSNQTLIFSPVLLAAGSTLPGEATSTAGLVGQIVDSATFQPLAGVEVVINPYGVPLTVSSDANGMFSFSGLETADNQLFCSLPGYLPYYSAEVVLQPNMVLDLGQIAMRSESSANLLPDLFVEKIDGAALTNDPQTLAVSGLIVVTVKNGGLGEARPSTGLVAFYDVNNNGVYDSATDIQLAQDYTSTTLSPGGSEEVQMALHGVLPYRDAPVTVQVDSDEVVSERDEGNNAKMTSDSCSLAAATGALQPVVKFHALQGIQVSSTPMVARLTDDNSDGLIDEKDIPNIVVVDRSGLIHVIGGDDGREIFVTSSLYPAKQYNEIAIADIDGDHLPELVVAHQDANHLMAFDHTGKLKWLSDSHSLPGSAYSSGVPSIADLDGDGNPEIIVGGAVIFSSTGAYLADGRNLGGTIGYNVATASSSIADINLDGIPEIIAGPTAYQFINGKLSILWCRSDLSDGFSGVGNFDDDKFAEIVIVGNRRVRMLNHDGTDAEVWKPPTHGYVLIPGRGYGGAPTIADFDGDKINEIGIAGEYRYVVFENNGGVLWASYTVDTVSAITGSTAFDFDGDGSVEIVYRDELNLHIFRGIDGVSLYKKSVGSSTGIEMPVIADVDNDGHAEIAVSSDNLGTGIAEHTGVYVFEDASDLWMPTRSIWNEHEYHINNINDDGTIPQFEQPSWLTHNTSRLNTFGDRNPGADLTAGVLRVVDGGHGIFKLTVRIGNAGTLALSKTIPVTFYEGDPAAGGRLLGTINLAGLADNAFTDVTLEGVHSITGAAPIYAVVDPDGLIEECNKENNSLQVAGPPVFADLEVSGLQIADNGAGAPMHLAFTIDNSGAVATPDLSLIAFYSGSPLAGGALLGTMTIGTLLPGASQQLTYDSLNGNALGAELYVVVDADAKVNEYSECNNINHLTVPQSHSGLVAVSTDSPTYGGGQSVQTLAQVTNTSALPGEFTVRFQIEDTQGIVVATLPTVAAGRISGGGSAPVSISWNTGNCLAGTYAVRAYLDSSSALAIHAAASSFTIIHDNTAVPTLSLRTTTDKTTYLPGESVSIANLLTNQTANAIIDNAVLRLSISDAKGASVYTNEQSPGQLLPGMQKSISAIFAMGALPAGQYTLVGEVVDGVDGHLWASGQAVFAVSATTTTGVGLTGSLALAEQVYMGRPLAATFNVTNNGNEDVNNLAVRILIINPQTDALMLTIEQTINVARQTSYAGSVSVDTAQLEPGLYMAVLSVATPAMAKAKALGSGNFEVLPSLEVGTIPADPVNLLVWVNDGCARENKADPDADSDCEHGDGESDHVENNNSLSRAYGAYSAGNDEDDDKSGDDDSREEETGKECVPVGLLEPLLTATVDSHFLVYGRDDFERMLRSPYFTDIMILGDQAPLTAHADLELREMANAGTGLISALWSENTSAEQIFGIKVNGSFANGCKTPRSVATIASPVTTNGVLAVGGRLLKVEAADQQAVVGWVPDNGCAEENDHDERDERHDHGDPYPAIVLGEYGNGKSVFFNFNIGAELKPDNLAQFGGVLAGAIADVHTPRGTDAFQPYQLVPTVTSLHSLGGAFDLRLTETYSPELRLFDPLLGAWLTDNPQITETALGVDEYKNLFSYVLLPDQSGVFSITTEIGFVFGGEYSFFDSRLKTFAVQLSAQGLLQEIIAEIKVMGGSKTEKSKIKNVVNSLERLEIGSDIDRSDIEKNIANIEQAINWLLDLNRAEVSPIRLKLDELLKIEQRRWYFQVR